MKVIYCFSGTGNSLYVANTIAKEMDAEVRPMYLDEKEINADVIGFVFPVYFWNLPNQVEQFITQLTIKNPNAYIFTVITYGGYEFGASGLLRRILKKKGLTLAYANKVRAVENYIISYHAKDTEARQNLTTTKAKVIAKDIQQLKRKRAEHVLIINPIIKSFFPREEGQCDQHFSISNNCTSCGICEKVCLVHNITLQEGTPSFQHKCEQCLACVNRCPEQAINWKQKTQDKKRYTHPDISVAKWISFLNK